MNALLSHHRWTDDPEKVMVSLARKKVRMAVQAGWTGPPFDMKLLASILDLKVQGVPARQVSGGWGMLVPDGAGGLSIWVNQDTSVERQRFTIAHEIAHSFFPDCAKTVRHRARTPAEKEFERLCDQAASQLLFPEEAIQADVRSQGQPGLGLVDHLRTRYLASWEATAIRLVNVCERSFGVFVASPRQAARGVTLPPSLKVDYCMPAHRWGDYWRYVNKDLPRDSALQALLAVPTARIGGPPEGAAVEDWGCLDMGVVRVEGLVLPDSTRVLALVHPHA